MEKIKYKKFNESNLVLIAFILVGIFWIVEALSFPLNKNGISPSLFPIVTAIGMIAFSGASLINNIVKKRGMEDNTSRARFWLIAKIILLLITFLVLCKYVHSSVAIAAFIFLFMQFIARIKLKANLILTASATVILVIVIKLLNISL